MNNNLSSLNGNNTGIFDAAGGIEEYVMANLNDDVRSSSFPNSKMPNNKFYDLFNVPLGETGATCGEDIECLKNYRGQALLDVNKWYGNYTSYFNNN